jgi:hypothetical protein
LDKRELKGLNMTKKQKLWLVFLLMVLVTFTMILIPSKKYQPFFSFGPMKDLSANKFIERKIITCSIAFLALINCWVNLIKSYYNIIKGDKMKKFLKYVTALISGVLMFVLSFVIIGLILNIILPEKLYDVKINLYLLKANIISFISLIIGGIIATATFKASLNAKTGRLYRKKK